MRAQPAANSFDHLLEASAGVHYLHLGNSAQAIKSAVGGADGDDHVIYGRFGVSMSY